MWRRGSCRPFRTDTTSTTSSTPRNPNLSGGEVPAPATRRGASGRHSHAEPGTEIHEPGSADFSRHLGRRTSVRRAGELGRLKSPPPGAGSIRRTRAVGAPVTVDVNSLPRSAWECSLDAPRPVPPPPHHHTDRTRPRTRDAERRADTPTPSMGARWNANIIALNSGLLGCRPTSHGGRSNAGSFRRRRSDTELG